MFEATCLLCRNKCEQLSSYSGILYTCKTCGVYRATIEVARTLDISQRERNQISAFVRGRDIRNSGPILLLYEEPAPERARDLEPFTTIDEALGQFPEQISDRLDNAFLNLAKLSHHFGAVLQVSKLDYTLFYGEHSDYAAETIDYMIRQMATRGWIEQIESSPILWSFIVSVNGWDKIYELETRIGVRSRKVFIAMAFDPSLKQASDKIHAAIQSAGYEPYRVDDEEHNEAITDKIIAGIRASKFVVSDFTGQRNGVYYEAGFARGLGLPVIWTCRRDEMNELHFDTRQMNHIDWNDEDDLYARLLNRIRATIG